MVNLRTSTAIVVVGVAAVAAIQSYSHIYWLARTHGQTTLDSALLPLSVDGLILAMSLILLHEARADRDAPRLAVAMLWFGVVATILANVVYGLRYGITGACVSAWPARAFIGAVHVVASVARAWSAEPLWSSAQVSDATDPAASLAADSPISERKLARQFGISRPRAKRIRTEVTEGTATA